MDHRWRPSAFLACLLAAVLFAPPQFAVQAEVFRTKVCAPVPEFRERDSTFDTCFSGPGHECFVAVRGHWLDTTNNLSIESGPTGTLRIVRTGIGNVGGCIPDMHPAEGRQGFVSVSIKNISGTGQLRLRLSRPSMDGGDHDTVSVSVVDGETYVNYPPGGYFPVRFGSPMTLRLTGRNLDRLQLRSPVEPGDRILSASENEAEVRLTFTEATGTSNPIDKKVQFPVAARLNELHGWPLFWNNLPPLETPRLIEGAPIQTSPLQGVRPIAAALPNLVPLRGNASSPLLHKINGAKTGSLMINAAFCNGLADNEEREVSVPDFDWMVTNSSITAIPTAFTVTLLGGAPSGSLTTGAGTPNTVSTHVVARLDGNARGTFRNWPGRPTGVRVIKVAGGPLLADYQNAPGCYIPNAFARTVIMDPKPLLIRVDSEGEVTERNEGDNDLNVN